MEENVKVLTIAELIHGARPLTGTSSLHSHCNRPTSRTSLSNYRTPFGPPIPNGNPNPNILTPLNHPSILIGTLTLTLNFTHNNCLQFTDDSSEICCDILDFSVHAIGKKIHVSAWNFIPLNRGNGFLEIIKWHFPESTVMLNRCSNIDSFDSFPLISGSFSTGKTDSLKSRYQVHGSLESLSPVSTVPCSRPGSSPDSTNIRGFLLRLMSCECKSCSFKESKISQESHTFTKLEFVYFCCAASSWHSVMTKLVGNFITISGLKKKLVVIGKGKSQLMFVTAENSVLHVPRLLKKWLPVYRTVIKGKGECGRYTGVVKGVYMQGMVIELDNDVWLLLTDKLLTVPHSIRLGAVISLSNVHFVNPRFSWAKVLILGACCKTSVTVVSFSPLESGCYIDAKLESLLGKYIDSLSFSARLWALLVVSCFRKKFSGFLSDKEIMGSKHLMWIVARCYQKKGLAQMYASSHIPSSVIRARHGIFTEFCNHESCGCGSEPYCGNLRLVVPISTFVYHCETAWMKTLLQLDSDGRTLHVRNQYSFLSFESKSHRQSKRRIFPSEDIGFVLLGSLKISPSSGRLQLVDMTGSIDVIVPDLSSTLKENSVYEVTDYGLMLEDVPELVDRLGLPRDESFSCRTIFGCAPLANKGNTSMFVYFHMHNTISRNHCFYPSVDQTNNFKELESGEFHLIQVTHKFPLLQKLQSDPLVLNRSSMFIEAIVLPWNLVLFGKSGSRLTTKVLRDRPNELMEHCTSEDHKVYDPDKSLKADSTVSRGPSSGLMDDSAYLDSELSTRSCRESSKEWKCMNLNFSPEIPCLATVRSANNQSLVSSGILYCTKAGIKTNSNFQNFTEKVLLEFDSESSLKYQLLQIGGYYISKHHTEDPLCNIKDSDNVSGVKVLITSRSKFWSLTFSSGEVLTHEGSLHHPSSNDSSFGNPKVLAVDQQVDLLFWRVPGSSSGACADVHLYVSADAMHILMIDVKDLEEHFIKPSVRPEETFSISSCTCTILTLFGPSLEPPDCLFPEGNLITLCGDVVAVHGFDDRPVNEHGCERLSNVLQLRFFQELARNFCIHVLVDHEPVRVFGCIREHAYLIGFGPGVNATFHRILRMREPDSLMLIPVSFIVVNSIRVINKPFSEKSSNLWSDTHISNVASSDTVAPALISGLIRCSDCRSMRFRCRVVAVHVLVLEKSSKYDDICLETHSTAHLVEIPLAGFMLDDGSSSCCCWANAEQAATLLRLHEELPESVFENSEWALKWIGIDNPALNTTIYHLARILKKHEKITVMNYGSITDSSYQDLTISVGSDNGLTSSDENLLKFIIFNACFGTFWSLVANVMDSSAKRWLEEEYLVKMEMTMHSMQNIWASEVCYANPITEARDAIRELLER